MEEASLELGRLGETPGVRRVQDLRELQQLSRAMTAQARHRLDLLSGDLDAPLYDDAAFLDALKQLCTGSRRAQVRVLVADSGPAVRDGHRLIELARRLSSFITIHRLAAEDRDCNRAFLLADDTGYISRDGFDRYEAACDFAAPARATELAREFQLYWERSEPDPNLRRLHL